ncbi:hypothetical protein BDV96DRAFT_634855 [Lophiotrema nucula]|uniref:Major facilitator superfamily domain-containing protein n=1 Tax=Lophiotrema nucula TaxID=690887 RepID=A0A6A5YV07_9PLEO|nr:hypothetical protein BDV96DRAFT_634855 [Lophiotrema nucula]
MFESVKGRLLYRMMSFSCGVPFMFYGYDAGVLGGAQITKPFLHAMGNPTGTYVIPMIASSYTLAATVCRLFVSILAFASSSVQVCKPALGASHTSSSAGSSAVSASASSHAQSLHDRPLNDHAVQKMKQEIMNTLKLESEEENKFNVWSLFWDTSDLRAGRRIRISFLILSIEQMMGINLSVYYSTVIFKNVGFSDFLSQLLAAVMNTMFALAGAFGEWLFSFLTVFAGGIALERVGWKIWLWMMLSSWVAMPFVWFMCLETTGKSLEEIDLLFAKLEVKSSILAE